MREKLMFNFNWLNSFQVDSQNKKKKRVTVKPV